jgi:formyl-CoA transferase
MPSAPDAGLSPTPAGPLEGLRVLELGMLIAGPFAGRLLADLGAEVIKVEAPDRLDPMREWGQVTHAGRSLWWPVMSRNKKCVTLDLRRDEGRELLLELVEHSDAVIESFRPGTLERWGLGFERLREANAGIVLVRVSGYGQSGPYASRAGFASAAEAIGGLRYVNGFPGQLSPRFGISLGDSLAGMFAAQGLLAATVRRDALGGQGQEVDVSILESCFALLESAAPEYDRAGHVREPGGVRLPGIAPSSVFESADGRHVIIAANQDSLFRRLCDAMGRPELVDDPRFATHRSRYEHQDAIEAEIAEWAGRHTAAEIDAVLSRAGVVCGPINTIADIFEDPHVRDRDMLVEHVDAELGALVGPGVIPKFSETPGKVRWSGTWQPGASNDDVLGGLLGRSEAELGRLRGSGVI